jgi:hypothetical protein
VSPTDPPLPPSPDEPSEEPQWAGGVAGNPPDPEEPPVDGGPDGTGEVLPDDDTGAPEAPDEAAAETPESEAPTEVLPDSGEEVTQVLPTTGDDLTELLPPTGDEPTEVLAGAVPVADGTGEFTREHRRRVSHRRYVMRRIGVGIVALAVVGAGVLLLVTLLDDDGEGAVGTDTTTPVTSEAVLAQPTTRATTTTAAPETTDAEATATTASPETTEAAFTGDPATTASADETDRSGQIDPQDESDTTTATESSPPGSVAYDLDSEASCEIAQTLRRGDTGPQVECLQERLNEVTVGGQPFAVDGAFGEQTEAAVRAFQEANELAVDGVVGPATGELLGIWAV